MISKDDISVEEGKVSQAPSKPRYTLDQLVKEHMQLEREMGSRFTDQEFLDAKPIGKEIL